MMKNMGKYYYYLTKIIVYATGDKQASGSAILFICDITKIADELPTF